MLTAGEVRAVYKKLETVGKAQLPYVYTLKNTDKVMVFFGTVHTNDPNHPQVQLMHTAWDEFLKNSGEKLVIQERIMTVDDLGQTLQESIVAHEESGQVLWLAQESGIEAVTGEQSRNQEVQKLKAAGYTDAAIMTYYFGRQFVQWSRSDGINAPNWREYAKQVVDGYNKSVQCWDQPLTLQRVLTWFKLETSSEFDPKDQTVLSKIADPYTGEVARASGDIRDTHLLELIQSKWNSGKSLFIVYGSGHAIKLEPDIEACVAKDSL